ncbi:MAG: cation:proton antiporter [Spirochaetaceae bacterium]|nr:cation:proton antiporter [Spirochaetaceae bacterium]MDT8298409.1 cation:proton antiporter [Spirochaetaceae bacterium]
MHEGVSLTHLMTVLVLQLSLIVVVAKAFGFVTTRYLKQPSVLGELIAGMVIGPFALGRIPLGFLGGEPLFAIPHGAALPVTPELYGLATIASIVLLFLSGLETDLKTFLKFAGTGSLVGLGGVLATFFLGAGSAVLFIDRVTSIMDPAALFMGIIATATSVGISARILSERKKLSSPEGVTILSAAVLDDVLGIVLLAVVVGLVRSGGGTTGSVDWGLIGRIALKAFGFWLGSTVIGILLAPRITKGLKGLKDLETLSMIAFGLALLLAGLSELAGLAMIIGAYVMGLALSSTDVAEDIRHRLEGVYNFIVPIFFCVMGMLVDFSVIPEVVVYGLAYAFLGILGKIVGCGIPALLTGFTPRGALRIGTGMLPRGEVTLIMAGLGLSTGVLDSGLFGVAVMSMFISSLVAPPALVKVFKGGRGFKKSLETAEKEDVRTITFNMPSASLADFVLTRLLDAFRRADYFPRRIGHESPVYAVQKDAVQLTLLRDGTTISANVPPDQETFVRLLLTEEILSLKELFRSVEQVAESDSMERDMLSGLFDR